ncbi:MAG: TonB-dependent receptor [Rikenellaceae bacterium]|nr:TonB-dependent receptor [Rikenellaceae bacterium]
MKKRLLLLTLFAALPFVIFAQKYTISGTVLNRKGDVPVEMAVVALPLSDQWAVASDKGVFSIQNVAGGKVQIMVTCLGYVDAMYEFDLERDTTGMKLYLQEDNLSIESVVVTARENANSATTSRTIDRTAMDHMQMVNVSDLTSLLPGGKTLNPNLAGASSQRFEIRTGAEAGASFGTAVEVDGVRLSNNAAFNETAGASTRNISSANVESVEVITGVPSVEYGDMTNGIVKVNTRKGKSPYLVTFTTNPKTKQFSLSKGFELGKKSGTMNVSLERTKAISNLASPYSSYDRNTASLLYSNTFGRGKQPVRFSLGLAGNVGGSDTKADPDAARNTYSKVRDNTVRANFSVDWLLSKPWITNLEVSGSVSYSDRLSENYARKSAASSNGAAHGTSEGYFVASDYDANPGADVVLLPVGTWYERAYTDNKPLDYNVSLKANWSRKFGAVRNRVKLGANFTGSGNRGRGLYYEDMRYAPTWREYRYDQVPFMNNLAFYAEESVTVPIATTQLNIVAGVRSEHTMVQNSGYGNVNSLSPRFNAKYTLLQYDADRFVRNLVVRGSWGLATKLPSFNILYPEPTYEDILTFAPGTMVDGTTFYAYYIKPHQLEYNPNLRWQYNRQSEIGLDVDIKGVKISLAAYANKTRNTYTTRERYDPYSYKFTSQKALEGVAIPSGDRIYTVDPRTGVVTVGDRTGAHQSVTLAYQTRNTFMRETYADNGAPVIRKGLEWVVDFGMIKPLRTSVRIDGSYYYYKTIDETVVPYYPGGAMPDGQPYQYIAYFAGGHSASNGRVAKDVNCNLTLTTHLPQIRMILSLRLESGLYSFSRSLSEWGGGSRSFTVKDESDDPAYGKDDPGYGYEPGSPDIYDRGKYTITYPLYFASVSDPTPVPFQERFEWAKTNDPELYELMKKMVVRSDYGYSFNTRRISPYFAANVSVTKEIGDIASISFYANNFFNNMGHVTSTQNDNKISLFGSSYIPSFYYGLTLRLKF